MGESSSLFAILFYKWNNLPKPDSDVIYIPYFDHMNVSAGTGSEVFYDEPDGMYKISKSLLRISSDNLKCIKVTGHSMVPRIYEGDYVVIDMTVQVVQQEGMYVVCVDNALLVKYVQWLPRGIMLISENKDYKPIELTEDNYNMDYVRILGKVVWILAKA